MGKSRGKRCDVESSLEVEKKQFSERGGGNGGGPVGARVGGGERRRHKKVGHKKDNVLPRKSGNFEKNTKFLPESISISH